jgi:hypothetical protein
MAASAGRTRQGMRWRNKIIGHLSMGSLPMNEMTKPVTTAWRVLFTLVFYPVISYGVAR